jgi:hypothetical protein
MVHEHAAEGSRLTNACDNKSLPANIDSPWDGKVQEYRQRFLDTCKGELDYHTSKGYVPRKQAQEEYKIFLGSKAHVFVLTGEHGIGKTTFSLKAAEEASQQHVVRFLWARTGATEIRDGFEETMADLCDHLSALGKTQRLAIFFIDGLNEAPQRPEVKEVLGPILTGKGPASDRVKVVINCRTNDWRDEFSAGQWLEGCLYSSLIVSFRSACRAG